MKVLGRVILGVLVVAIGAGAYWYFMLRPGSPGASSSQTADPTSFSQVVAVQTGDLSAKISVVGELYAVQQEDLKLERMDGSAPLLELKVATGNKVTAGQVLATIDPIPYQQALDQAVSATESAEETLSDLQTPPTELAIAKADLTVAKAKLDLEQAEQDSAELAAPDLTILQAAVEDALDLLKSAQNQRAQAEVDTNAKTVRDLLYAIGWHERSIAELQDLVGRGAANLEQTEKLVGERENLTEASANLARVQSQRQISLSADDAEVATAEAALADARGKLADAQAGDELALAKAKLAVQQAQVALKSAEEKRADLDAGPDAVKLAAALAAVDKQRLAVSEAELDLAGATIVAPFDGTVLKVGARVGDLVTANTLVATVADLTQLEVLAAVDETTIRQVSAGQDALITFDAFPGRNLTGRVLSVPLQGSLQGGVTIYQVPVSLEGAGDLDLLVGMTANVAIQTGQVQNALLIPSLAVQNIGGFTQVLVPSGSTPDSVPVSVPVEVGLSDGVYTQVLRGLNATDQVVVQLQSSTSQQQFRMGGGIGAMGGAMNVRIDRR